MRRERLTNVIACAAAALTDVHCAVNVEASHEGSQRSLGHADPDQIRPERLTFYPNVSHLEGFDVILDWVWRSVNAEAFNPNVSGSHFYYWQQFF